MPETLAEMKDLYKEDCDEVLFNNKLPTNTKAHSDKELEEPCLSWTIGTQMQVPCKDDVEVLAPTVTRGAPTLASSTSASDDSEVVSSSCSATSIFLTEESTYDLWWGRVPEFHSNVLEGSYIEHGPALQAYWEAPVDTCHSYCRSCGPEAKVILEATIATAAALVQPVFTCHESLGQAAGDDSLPAHHLRWVEALVGR